MLNRLLPLMLAACPGAAFAAGGRPQTTDDATLTNARSCQIETWFQHARGDEQLWSLPACNPTGNFEITAGALLDFPDHRANARQYTLQGKLVWPHPPGDAKDFATAGLAFGAFYLDARATNAWSSVFAYVPLTLRWTENTQTHFNLGWSRDLIGHHEDLTYDAAFSDDIGPRYNVFAEVFGVGRAKPSMDAGGALIFLDGVVQLDGSVGRPLSGNWRGLIFSVGAEWYPPALW